MLPIVPLQFGIPGGPELLVIVLIAVLLFGANKIPKLARSTGQAMGEFRRGREEIEQELDEMTGEVQEATRVDSDVNTPASEAETTTETESAEPADADTDESK